MSCGWAEWWQKCEPGPFNPDGTGELLKDFSASFGPEVEVTVVSYPADKALTYRDLEAAARRFLPQNQPYFLLAESFSGPIAISIAASSPPGLCGLILSCSFARNPLPMPRFLRPLLGLVPVSLMPLGVIGYFLLDRFTSPMLLDALKKALREVPASVLRARAREALAADARHALARVRIPLLYLRASEDRVVSRSSSELIATLAPQCQLAEFRAPHFLLQVLPSQAASRVKQFMQDCGRSGIRMSGSPHTEMANVTAASTSL